MVRDGAPAPRRCFYFPNEDEPTLAAIADSNRVVATIRTATRGARMTRQGKLAHSFGRWIAGAAMLGLLAGPAVAQARKDAPATAAQPRKDAPAAQPRKDIP